MVLQAFREDDPWLLTVVELVKLWDFVRIVGIVVVSGWINPEIDTKDLARIRIIGPLP